MLAGVGVSWYTWLEQGRDITVSAEVLDAASHDWVHDAYSHGTWATFRAGQFGRFERALARPEGRVHFTLV